MPRRMQTKIQMCTPEAFLRKRSMKSATKTDINNNGGTKVSIFSRLAEERERRREEKHQALMALSEKELLVEIVLLLDDISRKSDEIQRKQVLYSD